MVLCSDVHILHCMSTTSVLPAEPDAITAMPLSLDSEAVGARCFLKIFQNSCVMPGRQNDCLFVSIIRLPLCNRSLFLSLARLIMNVIVQH